MQKTETSKPKERFNLVDEPWIPVSGSGLVSLREIFSNPDLASFGGNARQKIALLKLLLAIAQAAATPESDDDWEEMGPEGMGDKCLAYLDKWHSKFFLYGPEPFLQMPVEKGALFSCGALQPEIALGNNPRLFHMQCDQPLTDAEKALVLLTEINMALGGKRGDKNLSLAPELVKSSAAASPGMGFQGFLHSFLIGESILQTIWLNLASEDVISECPSAGDHLCPPPWEEMPRTETCEIAKRLAASFMGRLMPMSRFCLLDEDGVHFTEGISHPSYKAGRWDPSVASINEKKGPRMLWADPEKRPWRSLSALLAGINSNRVDAFFCFNLKSGIQRLVNMDYGKFGIWSGGLKVSSNSGQQYLTGSDDNVESISWLESDYFSGEEWYPRLENFMLWLENAARILFGCVFQYYKKMGDEKSSHPAQACSVFWELAESLWQPLIEACQESSKLPDLYLRYRTMAQEAYNQFCPNESSKQMTAWAEFYPKIKLPEKISKQGA